MTSETNGQEAFASEDGISVVVLTRDRFPLLRRCLRSVQAQNDAPLEIIVVDNGSEDETPESIAREFPDVVLIRNEENQGIAGRNQGFRAARGKHVLSLDDDVELFRPDTLDALRDEFRAVPDAGAITLKITEEETGSDFVEHHWWHPKDRARFQDERFTTDRINEAAVAFDAGALREIDYYYEALFWGGEEWDLVLGLFDAGYCVRYLPVPVLHLAPRGSLNVKADHRHSLLVRNRFWIAFRRLPWPDALSVVLPRAALWTLRSIRYGYFGRFAGGLLDLARRFPEILRDRRPISAETKRRLRQIRSGW